MDLIDMNKVIKKQPIVNMGVIGHVSNGKSTVTKCLTGIATQKHSDEKKRNITIKMGYANARIFKCHECDEPECYDSTGEEVETMKCKHCESDMELVNHISICDVPGHNSFMTAMMNGTSVMDYTILIESAMNKEFPAPQTTEHLLCTNISKIPNVACCLNKLDIIKKSDAKVYMEKLKSELIGTQAEDSPLIPISATMGLNIDALLQILANLKPKDKNYEEKGVMFIVRSFNINKCGTTVQDLKGGVVGGSIIKGHFKLDDEVIIKPGYVTKNTEGTSKFKYYPIKTKINTINSEKTNLELAVSGGLIGVGMDIDCGLTANDGLVGSILMSETYEKDNIYKVYEELELEFEKFRDSEIKLNMNVLINMNSSNCKGKVREIDGSKIKVELMDKPVCVKHGDFCTISSFESEIIKIMGRGKVMDGKESFIY